MCFVGSEELVWTFGQEELAVLQFSIVYRYINLFKICQILGDTTFLGFLSSCGISFSVWAF